MIYAATWFEMTEVQSVNLATCCAGIPSTLIRCIAEMNAASHAAVRSQYMSILDSYAGDTCLYYCQIW